MTVGCTHAVATGVATADNKNIFAFCRYALTGRNLRACNNAVLLLEQFESEVHAFEVASLHIEVAGYTRADSDAHSIKLVDNLLDSDVGANFHATDEFHAFFFHEFHATIDNRFVELEVGDTEAEETARSFVFLIHGDLVTGAVEAISAGETGRTGTDYSDSLC